MLKLKIEKGIPLPTSNGKERGKITHTFVEMMEEGDSIVLPVKKARSLSCYVRTYLKEWKAPVRVIRDDSGNASGNARVWKIKREGSS